MITIEIKPTGNGSDVDLFINNEFQHTFDGAVTAIESLKLDYWQQELKEYGPNYIKPNA